MEKENKTYLGDINSFAFIKSGAKSGSAPPAPQAAAAPVKASVKPEINAKYDWYQNATHVFVTFKVVGDKDLAKNTEISFTESSFTLKSSDQEIKVDLSGKIDSEIS